METEARTPEQPTPPTPEEARAALADAERIRQATAARSATPWPTWFAAVLTGYIALFPLAYGGMVADEEWLLPNAVWTGTLVLTTLAYLALFGYAARAWRQRTGVALRFDVLPKAVAVPLMCGLPVVLVGSAMAFRATGEPAWVVTASPVGAALSVGCHLMFVRLHRKAAPAPAATAR